VRHWSAEGKTNKGQLTYPFGYRRALVWIEQNVGPLLAGPVTGHAGLRDVLTKIIAKHPMSRVDKLLAFAYLPAQVEKAAA
jgi:hypothetical protein